jgi:alpha-glucosidase
VAAKLYEILKPYRESCSELWIEDGIPVLSHPALAYPDEEKLWDRSDQYLFGADVLVAPGASDRDGTRRLELPNDDWIHLWTSRHYPAGTTVVHAPAGRPAVFYRARSEFAPLFDALRQKAARL